MRFKIDWASLIVGSKLLFLLCFTLYLRTISKNKPPPPGGLYLEGRFNGGFWRYEFGGAHIWGGGSLYMEGLIFGILR